MLACEAGVIHALLRLQFIQTCASVGMSMADLNQVGKNSYLVPFASASAYEPLLQSPPKHAGAKPTLQSKKT